MLPLLSVITWILLALVVYIYVGYAILLTLLSKIIPNPVKQGEIRPQVSLIVAAYNEQDVIGQKAENSLELNYPRDLLEIIFVTDGSSDSTPEIVRGYADRGVVLMHSPERKGKSAAINRAAASAKGEILVFSDANAFYDKEAIRHLLRNFNDPQVGCVSGKKTVIKSGDSAIGDSEGFYWKYESYIKKKESLIRSTTGVVGEMTAIRKSLFTPIPEKIINDDAYLAMRVLQKGYRVIYEPDAFSWETSAVSTRDEVIRRQRINAGRYQLLFSPRELWPWNDLLVLFELISHKFFRLLLPFFMIAAFVFNALVILLGSTDPLLWFAFIAQVICYALAFLGFIAEKNGWRVKLLSIPYYIVSSNVAALRGFSRYMSGKQSVLWEKAARGKVASE
jgi:poly-beta-1,6-N-acetyl-D-glucosamine synthase